MLIEEISGPGPGNPAEWVAAIGAVGALIVAGVSIWMSNRAIRESKNARKQVDKLHEEVNRPSWFITVQPYVVNAPWKVLHNLERGTQWSVENLGRVPARHVRVRSAWPGALHLEPAMSKDLGSIADGDQSTIVYEPDPEFARPEDTTYREGERWPMLASFVEQLRLGQVDDGRVLVEWRGSDGSLYTKEIPVVINPETILSVGIVNQISVAPAERTAVVDWTRADGRLRTSHVDRALVEPAV